MRMSLSLERLSNLAVIAVAVVVVAAFVRHEFLPRKSLAPVTAQSFVGKHIQLAGLPPSAGGRRLLLGISTTCHFCAENADFYRTLSGARQQDGLQLVALLPEPSPESTAYLQNKGITVDRVLSEPLADANIDSTPTLLLLDSTGTVKQAWIGALNKRSQQDVLNSLRHVEQ